MSPPEIELIVRAVIVRGSRLLLAHSIGEAWYFLPGGHVEPGESAASALRRELDEELGVRDLHVGGVTAIIENRYADARGEHHEVNLVHGWPSTARSAVLESRTSASGGSTCPRWARSSCDLMRSPSWSGWDSTGPSWTCRRTGSRRRTGAAD